MKLTFRTLLEDYNLEPSRVLVLRHKPPETRLQKVMPWIADKRPDLFNFYQSIQNTRVEAQMARATHGAAFIGHKVGLALFVGLYKNEGAHTVSQDSIRQDPDQIALCALGMEESEGYRIDVKRFTLQLCDQLIELKGRLVVTWPPPALSWARWADRDFLVYALNENSALVTKTGRWEDVTVTYAELRQRVVMWEHDLARWRGIYYIFDTKRNAGYVGSASGQDNIWQRWTRHAEVGGDAEGFHGHDPDGLVFTILEPVSPSTPKKAVELLEANWKRRLHTTTHGLNRN